MDTNFVVGSDLLLVVVCPLTRMGHDPWHSRVMVGSSLGRVVVGTLIFVALGYNNSNGHLARLI